MCGINMQRLTTDLVAQACRIFFSLAYPGGDATIPAAKQRLLQLPAGLEMVQVVETEASMSGCCQVIPSGTGGVRAVLVRLGCCHYPNLKLKAQLIQDGQESDWLFSVDTHDAFSSTSFLPPPEHPEAPAWRSLQAANVALKEKIEAAWDKAGLLTFNGLLRRDLPTTKPSHS
jgi:hypothetical protein